MAEDNKKETKKKQATLIKHKKQEPAGDVKEAKESDENKKKVVVVKKVIKVRKNIVQPVKTQDERTREAVRIPEKNDTVPPHKSANRFLGRSPREPSPLDKNSGPRENKQTRRPAFAPTDRPPRDNKVGYRGPKKPETSPRPFTKRADGRTDKKFPVKPPFKKPGTTSEPEAGDKKPPSNKRFYKTKKKAVYQKKKQIEFDEKIKPVVKKRDTPTANPIPKEISILEVITVAELAKKMNLKASDLIAKLMSMGMMVTINQQIDADTATILAEEYGSKVNIVSLFDETVIEEEEDRVEDMKSRPPIVTVMGHVDHGKTKLLDAIRQTNVVDKEHGGITQHIGAYTVDLPQGKIVFLDTPGHEAFTSMRARGAQITDIVVLVVAANDGVMPQTIEAINHAKAAGVPIIVAVNKIDLQDANPDRVKQQLAEYELMPESWGGHTLFSEISALKRQGIENLLDNILLQAEMLELKAVYTKKAAGRVLESKIDLGRGIVATVLVERGTLKIGDSFIAGVYPGRVRAMFDDKGEKLEVTTPSIPVEILGFTGIPNAGDPFHVTANEKIARQIALKRQELKKMESAQNISKVTLDNFYDQIKQGEVQELKVIVKGDVNGSVEALKGSLVKLSTNEIRLNVIHASAGAINDNDVLLAAASNAIVIGFHVRPTQSAQSIADKEKVDIHKYSIIYDAIEAIRSAMEGLLAPELREETIGMVEVRDTFKVPKIGTIAGCYVTSGSVRRNAQVRLVRGGVELCEGKISSLKRFKDDVKEVETGYECGIGIDNYNDIKVGDQIEVFVIKEFAKKLGDSKNDMGNKKEEN